MNDPSIVLIAATCLAFAICAWMTFRTPRIARRTPQRASQLWLDGLEPNWDWPERRDLHG
jgi:hypothetical protein